MVWLLVVLIVTTVAHLAYESMIAPSLRLSLRYELFALRDELRQLKMGRGSSFADRHFHFLQDSINTLLSVLNHFDLATLWALEQQLQSDRVLRERMEMRARTLDDCAIPEVALIRRNTITIAARAIAVNNGICALCAVPFLAAFWGLAKLKRLIRESIALPEPDIQRAIPSSSAADSPT
jgi:hypothetical protein